MAYVRLWLLPLCLILGACAQTPQQDSAALSGDAPPAYQDYWQTISLEDLPAITPAPGGLTNLAGTTPPEIPLPEPEEAGVIWDRFAAALTIAHIEHARIDEHVASFRRQKRHIDTITQRASPFLHYIVEETQRRGLPVELAMIPMIESGYQPEAVSPGRAAGLWQIRPATGRHLGLEQNRWYDGRHDIRDSTRAALDYLEFLHEKFDGDWLLAMAGYNAGWGRVQEIMRSNRRQGRPTDFWSLPLPRITQAYIPKVLALSRILADPEAYGISVQAIPNEPVLVEVDVAPSMDLSMAATKAGISKETLLAYNPGFKRGVVPPQEQPWQLLLPRDEGLALQARLENLQPDEQPLLAENTLAPTFGDAPGDPTATQLVDSASDALQNATDNPGQQPQLVSNRDLNQELAQQQRNEQQLAANNDADALPLEYRYTVREGDTLSTIAQRYGLSTVELARDNRRAIDAVLKVGESLAINTALPDSSNEPSDDAQETTQTIVNYLVQEGDSLWNISEQFQVSVAELRRWNDIPEWLQQPDPGKIIVVYLDVEPTQGWGWVP